VTAVLRPVVVGVDGSPASRAAATTAAQEAHRALRPLRLVRAVAATASGPDPSGAARRAAEELDALRAALRCEAPAIPVQTAVRAGPPGLVLLDESRTAALLVLGSGPPGAAEPGAVAALVAARASCPVLLDRPAPAGATGVVVGVDGGPGTGALLGAATTEACLRSTSLLVLHAWRRLREAEADPRYEDAVTDAERRLVEQYAERLRESHPGVPITVRVVHGDAAPALIAASAAAELVVLGRPAARGAARGDAVGPAVAAGAAAPVLVVPLLPTPQVPEPRRPRRSAVALGH
jgi:hypothetical protein